MTDILKLTCDDDIPGTLHAGWDFVITQPDEEAEVRCRVCGEVMEVTRGAVGPTGWAHALAFEAGTACGIPHDEFACAYSGEAWHRQALALKREARTTPSREVEKLLQAEVEEIVRTRTATKPT